MQIVETTISYFISFHKAQIKRVISAEIVTTHAKDLNANDFWLLPGLLTSPIDYLLKTFHFAYSS